MSYYAEIYGWQAEEDRLAKHESYKAMIRNERQAAMDDQIRRDQNHRAAVAAKKAGSITGYRPDGSPIYDWSQYPA